MAAQVMEARRKVPVINDFAVAEDAHDHRKTRKLRKLLGSSFYEGWWCLTRLWRWVTCRGGQDANWRGYLGDCPEDIEGEADWSGMPGTFLAALVEVGYVDEREGGYWIHDFHESQPHVEQIIDLLEKKREAGRMGGIASGKVRQAKAKQAEADVKHTEAGRSKPEAKRTPEAEAEAEAVITKNPCATSDEVAQVRGRWNQLAKKHGMAPVRDTKGRNDAIRQALRRKEFRDHWPEAMDIIDEAGGTPEGWSKALALTTVLRPVSMPKILDREWWTTAAKSGHTDDELEALVRKTREESGRRP